MPDLPRAAAPSATASCRLEAGLLRLTVDAGDPRLFGFAERNNPRRAFLFVSNILGRHVPVSPAVMRAAFTRLACTLPADLPGPLAMTGMAETAVGLGAGVHDAWLDRTGRGDTLYLATTRAQFQSARLTSFREDHSHASEHLVHLPQHPYDRDLLARARSLVMIDDEASSGNTFRNLAASLLGAGLTRIERVHTLVLTDWSGPAAAPLLPHHPGIAVTRTALLAGSFSWTPADDAPARTLPDADLLREGRIPPLPRPDDGRLGRSRRTQVHLPAGLIDALGPLPLCLLVLGTGEHVWEPFLLAEGLERLGHDVRFGATTRSPILPGHAIRRGYAFRDHEGLGIANYLYNVDPATADRIILCTDTALDAVDPRLLAALRADVVVGDTFHPREDVARRTTGAVPAEAFVARDTAP